MNSRHHEKIVISFICIILLLNFPGCKSTILTCNPAKEITVDGKADDWAQLKTNYFEDQQVAIGLASDNKRLFFMLRSRDKNLVRSVLNSGLTIWFDSSGKEKKNVALHYYGVPPGLSVSGADEKKRASKTAKKKPPKAEMKERLIFIDKSESRMLPIASDGSSGPAAAFDTSLGFFVYEFSIPIPEQPVRNYGLGIEPGHEIAIGIEYGGRDKMNRPDYGSPPGGGVSINMPGMGGGPGGKPGRGGQMKNDYPDFKEQEIWFKIVLPSDQ